MTPIHTKLQPNTLAALNAAFNSQSLSGLIKLSTWKAFYHTKPTIQAINHPFDLSLISRNGTG